MNPNGTPPAPGTPPTPPVSDNQAMAGMIAGLGATPPEQAQNLGLDFDSPNAIPMAEPAAPSVAPAPPVPQYPPVPPMPPATPPAAPAPAPTTPPAPGTPPAAPAAPAAPPDVIPFIPPTVPAPAPAAAPGMYTQEQVDAILAAAGRPPAAAAPAAPATPQKWEPDNWEDVEARIEQRAREIVQQSFTQQQAEAQAAAEQQQAALAAADKAIDTAVEQLEKNGYLPPVANPADPNDPGRAARSELYSYALALGTDDVTAAAVSLHALHQSGYFYDRTKNAYVRRGSQSAAAQAPIAGAAPVLPTGAPTGPTMADLATKSLSELSEEAQRAYPA